MLLITLDSCRYDTFVSALADNLKSIGPLHRAHAPANFTFASHNAIFTGVTPGVAAERKPLVNPKWGRIFRLAGGDLAGKGGALFVLDGWNIIEGFKRRGYATFGSGGVGWFDDTTKPGRVLSRDFEEFYFPGRYRYCRQQVDWLVDRIDDTDRPVFAFLNVGETHIPYWHEGAEWSFDENPCRPFTRGNDAEKCRIRQRSSLEYVDKVIAPLLERFSDGTVIVTADHGDAWGEDGLWAHGFHHETVLTVPLVVRRAPGLKPDYAGAAKQTAGRVTAGLRRRLAPEGA